MKIVKIKGGLGNQMFQYSLYKKLKNIENKTYGDLSYFNKNNYYELERIFNIEINPNYNLVLKKIFENDNLFFKLFRKFLKSILVKNVIQQNDVEFKENIFNYNYFVGYWQSEKFFQDIKEEIYLEFKFPPITEDKNLYIKNEIEKVESISIHVRRGDYIGNKVLDGLAPLEYYERALRYIKVKIKNPVFFIFSDDIEWCKENLKINFPTYYINWNKGEESFRDMQLMSLCKHNIIPNSSFSWWGAWLNNNPNKIVIAPEIWFRKETGYKYKDIVPETWIKIRNY
ncbi:alpha-1,2-fucosyltransferase [Fusobacterium varium]|uniref:alpha-1,2-fucosyltransferase n=1 Tax=Fusobacterium varium TaxID=856 RepID=UPI002FE4A95D